MPSPGAPVYVYGLDEPTRQARTITVESEREANEIADAIKYESLPTAYVIKLVIRCNQLDTFRMIACDWQKIITSRHENAEGRARRLLGGHFRQAHPYLDSAQRRRLQHAVHFTMRDV